MNYKQKNAMYLDRLDSSYLVFSLSPSLSFLERAALRSTGGSSPGGAGSLRSGSIRLLDFSAFSGSAPAGPPSF